MIASIEKAGNGRKGEVSNQLLIEAVRAGHSHGHDLDQIISLTADAVEIDYLRQFLDMRPNPLARLPSA